jgi:hypothetical protein
MALALARRTGSPPPDRAELESALRQNPWLTHRPDDPLRPGGTYTFMGGGLSIAPEPFADSPYAAPWLQVWLSSHHDIRTVAPGLVALAGELGLGIDIPGSDRWWEPPATIEPDILRRAAAVSATADGPDGWLLLGFVLADVDCLALAESNPALAVLASGVDWFRDSPGMTTPERRAFLRQLAREPRHRILERIGARGTPSMVKLLSRIAPRDLDSETLRLLTSGGLPPLVERALRHLGPFHCHLLRLVADPDVQPHAGPRLLREVAQAGNGFAALFRLRDTLDMAAHLGQAGRVGVVSSSATLNELHDAILAECLARGGPLPNAARIRSSTTTPDAPASPPPAGTPSIVPLRTDAGLREEGRAMRSCVLSYGPRLATGRFAVYRVLAPERATLSLRLAPDETWVIEQLLGPQNRPVASATDQAVRDWLAGNRSGVLLVRPSPPVEERPEERVVGLVRVGRAVPVMNGHLDAAVAAERPGVDLVDAGRASVVVGHPVVVVVDAGAIAHREPPHQQ